jgi:hypothetical protein
MAIKVQCENCGSGFQAKDALAGRRVKCPKCKTALTIPAVNKTPAASKTQSAVAAAAHNPLLDLLDEQNVRSASRGPVCASCGSDLLPRAIVCVECGFNVETGVQVKAEIYEDDLSAQASEATMSDADRIMAKAEKEIEDMPVTAEGQDFGDGAESFLIAGVAFVIGLVLIGIGMTVIFSMEKITEVIASSAISFMASVGLYVAMGLWITIVGFYQKKGQGIACACTAFLWCVVFGFMQGKQLLLPTIILLFSLVVGAASGAYTFYNGWGPAEA